MGRWLVRFVSTGGTLADFYVNADGRREAEDALRRKYSVKRILSVVSIGPAIEDAKGGKG
jgi:hypothetical protein